MYPENKYDGPCEVDRVALTYETQVAELHRLADRLKEKVRHISTDLPRASEAKLGTQIRTPLDGALQDVINHFEGIIDNICN